MPIYRLTELPVFPDPEGAEDGIVAVGGDLSTDRLIMAYQSGIFPWYNDDEPIIWWSPDPRCVLMPADLRISKSMRHLFKKKAFRVTFDHDFSSVIRMCADVRSKDREGTWINEGIISSYGKLHEMQLAHSVEVWNAQGELVGGLYGLAMGKCFFGESMFHTVSNASKYAFIALVQMLVQRGYELMDCQVYNPHLETLGATVIPRSIFLSLLDQYIGDTVELESWKSWTFEKLEL